MLLTNKNTFVYVYSKPISMANSFNGLCKIIKTQLERDPFSGECFCFANKKRTYIKMLYFDGTGFCLFAKKCIGGTFALPNGGKKGGLSIDSKKLIEVIKTS
jgi:transposase